MQKIFFILILVFMFGNISVATDIITQKNIDLPFNILAEQFKNNLNKAYGKNFRLNRDLSYTKDNGSLYMKWNTIDDYKNKISQRERFKIDLMEIDKYTTNVKIKYEIEFSKKDKWITPDDETLSDCYKDLWKILEEENTANIKKQEVKKIDVDIIVIKKKNLSEKEKNKKIKEKEQEKNFNLEKIKTRQYNIHYDKIYSIMLSNVAKRLKTIEFADKDSGVILTGWIYPGDVFQSLVLKRRFKINLNFKKINENKTNVCTENTTQIFFYDWTDVKQSKQKKKHLIRDYNALFEVLEDGLLQN